MSHSSNSMNDFEIDLSDNGEYTAPGMQLALMQQIPLESDVQIHVKSINELERQYATLMQDSQLQPIIIALNTPSYLDENRAHWSLIVMHKGNVCYCNTLTSDFSINENVIRTLSNNAHAVAFQSFNIEALNQDHSIAAIADMNLGVCGYWVESMSAAVLNNFDKLMQGNANPLLQSLRQKINGNFDRFVQNGFDRWANRNNQIRHSQFQAMIEQRAAAADKKRKNTLQLTIDSVNKLNEFAQSLHPDSDISTRYAAINTIFYASIVKENNAEKQYQAVAQHWEQMHALMAAAEKAVALSKTLHLDIPSSFSKEFAAHKADNTLKDAIAFIEAQVMASLIAFQNPPVNRRAEFLNKIVADLITATQNATIMIEHAKQHIAAKSVDAILNHYLPRLLQGKPQYQDILAKTLGKRADAHIDDAVNKLLLELYLETYKVSREKKLLSSSKVSDEITPWLEKILMDRYRGIHSMMPYHGIKNTLANRIICYAGETYPDFIQATRTELQNFGSEPQQNRSIDENRKRFVSMGKLLGRLGQAGFQACSQFFANSKDQYVKENEIGKYYDKNLASRINANVAHKK
jgi:hypothetical protein